jgi:hypothetical protein
VRSIVVVLVLTVMYPSPVNSGSGYIRTFRRHRSLCGARFHVVNGRFNDGAGYVNNGKVHLKPAKRRSGWAGLPAGAGGDDLGHGVLQRVRGIGRTTLDLSIGLGDDGERPRDPFR